LCKKWLSLANPSQDFIGNQGEDLAAIMNVAARNIKNKNGKKFDATHSQ
jgi:hypothetical protein